MLGEGWHHHAGIFRALALVDADGIGMNQLVYLEEVIINGRAIDIDGHGLLDDVQLGDPANVPVVDILIVIVDGLHDLIADPENLPAQTPLRVPAGWIQALLEDVVQV